MESRVTVLESHVEYIKRDIGEIKSDVKYIKTDVVDIKLGIAVLSSEMKLSESRITLKLFLAMLTFTGLIIAAIKL